MLSIFTQAPTLENPRALLKPLEEEDFDALCEVGADSSLWQLATSLVQNRDDLLNYLQKAVNQRTVGQALPFTIIDKRSGNIAGCTRFGNFSWEHRRVEIGWTWLGIAFQKTGLNRAVKYELLNYAFNTLHMNRVELKADALNTNSRDAMRKIGATEEGTLRQHMITESGRVRDTVYFSIVESEWPRIAQTVFAEFTRNS